jgi:hypothetical protein
MKPGEAVIVELHIVRRQAVGVIRRRERPVERPHQAHGLARHVGKQGTRLQQVDAEPHADAAIARETKRKNEPTPSAASLLPSVVP